MEVTSLGQQANQELRDSSHLHRQKEVEVAEEKDVEEMMINHLNVVVKVLMNHSSQMVEVEENVSMPVL